MTSVTLHKAIIQGPRVDWLRQFRPRRNRTVDRRRCI